MNRSSMLRRAARAAFAVCVLAIVWLALAPVAESPGLGWDKTNHLVAFLTLAALADAAWPGRSALPWRVGLLLVFGIFIELVQGALPYRDGSLLDFAADALGVGLYLALKQALLRARQLAGPARP